MSARHLITIDEEIIVRIACGARGSVVATGHLPSVTCPACKRIAAMKADQKKRAAEPQLRLPLSA